MLKFASITLTIILVYWIRIAFSNGAAHAHNDDPVYAAFIVATALWFTVAGSFFAWRMVLAMVRQLGDAVRNK